MRIRSISTSESPGMNRTHIGMGGWGRRWGYLAATAVGAVAGSLGSLVSCGSAVRGGAFDASRPMFPSMKGENLNKRAFDVPGTLDARYNVLMVAFLQEQQKDVDTWVPTMKELTHRYADVEYYELPTISATAVMGTVSLWLDDAMRSGIPDLGARERTITLYTDTEKFREAAGIDGRERIWVGVVDREGKVYWSVRGAATEGALAELRRVVGSLPR